MKMGREFALGLSFWQLDRAEGMDKAARSGGSEFSSVRVAQAETLIREFPICSMPSFL